MQINVILIKVLAAASWRGRLRTTSVLASAAAPSAAAQHWPPAETSGGATLTYLEINGWLISAAGVTVLVDPILEGRLDFGIPALFAASKQRPPSPAAIRHRRSGSTSSLPPLDALLITQGLDDHAHARTLARLAELDPTLPILAPPSALPAVERAFGRGVVQSREGSGDCALGGGLRVTATSGALVGPPWQRRENGRRCRTAPGAAPSLYLEPHVEFDEDELRAFAPVDAVITPTRGQALPGFELVHGPAAAVRLVETLRPRLVLPMSNGAIDAAGIAAPLVTPIGAGNEFERLLAEAGVGAEVLEVRPGEPLTIG
ncbi:hypothetical protein EMIHUDRAFT_66097 [Emiliania huxleyi CCMP1516]|uniref:Metallo-beta-lactamase domain-containing protein n=2 Tax=Emiliania huxleyi TaxID=2903 RepID=A0A0D3IYQ6_EMIH1|nr:hypothetical protein EMIHUDRAFT_66097 [Emiliania huxleyi CCMP1516]EOD16391.1 hypothetical protein EMIHUDRAFT_66097 [Emiliania huxleyi CCMP1516]|eukprot:XP_005768820.1 hypothetical protein EMIHUDRAFT_66097 [Emiliania huxleyi CCMP1516]